MNRQAKLDDYAFRTIKEYEALCGTQVNEAFRLGWNMARTTNRMLGITEEQLRVDEELRQKRCTLCDGSGDVHTPTGEFRGQCYCEVGKM